MRIRNMLITIILCTVTNGAVIYAQDNTASGKQPSVSTLPSEYISFTNTSLVTSKGIMTFEGNFIVHGKGIYGHFEATVYGDSGAIIQRVKSEDRAWRKELGSKMKSISLSLGPVSTCSKVEVIFQDTQIKSNSESDE
jgi:isopentenyl phosphate kinase